MAVNEERWGAVLRAFAAPERPEAAPRCMRCRAIVVDATPHVRWDTDPAIMERFLAVHKEILSTAAGLLGDPPTEYPFLLCPACRVAA